MQMHWCVCKVNLSGQNFTTFEFNETCPVSWPEVQVISAIHGDGNVYDIKPVKIGETTPRLEKDRLQAKYPYQIVEAAFPGRSFRMEMLQPGEETDQAKVDRDGAPIAHGNGDDDEEDGDEAKTLPPPPGAVFKPGKQRPVGA